MDEILERLAFFEDPLYGQVRLKEAVYDEAKDKLTLRFIHSEEFQLSELKGRLEKDVIEWVGESGIKFEYEQSYIDEELLALKVKNLLVGNFGVLLVGLGERDIVVSYEAGTFTVELHMPQDIGEYVRQTTVFRGFLDGLARDYFADFVVNFVDKPLEGVGSIEELEKYMLDVNPTQRVNKTMHIRGLEYYLGKPIQERPIKIEFLRVSPNDQVIAGKIMFLTQKTYKKDEEEKPYWTFVLDDGKGRAQCVFFPNQKSKPLFEKLVDGTVIAAIGTQGERNGRTSFRVSGISFCEL